MRKRLLARFALVVSATALALMAVTLGCQSQFIYHPRQVGSDLEARLTQAGARRLHYGTSEGRQTAYYAPPRDGSAGVPDAIWVLTAGNGSLATDWLEDIQRWSPRFGWLLVDYPGYGECPGNPNPERIRANYIAAYSRLAGELQTTPEVLKPRAGSTTNTSSGTRST